MLSLNKKENIYSRGGLRIGDSYWNAANYTWPFGKLHLVGEGLYLERLILKREWFIPSENVIKVKKIRGVIPCLSGYQIEHMNPRLPGIVIFWSCCDLKLEKKFY